jgi:hypothetical protein
VKHFYAIVQVENVETKKMAAFMYSFSQNDNLYAVIRDFTHNKKRIFGFNVCPTKKEAEKIVRNINNDYIARDILEV